MNEELVRALTAYIQRMQSRPPRPGAAGRDPRPPPPAKARPSPQRDGGQGGYAKNGPNGDLAPPSRQGNLSPMEYLGGYARFISEYPGNVANETGRVANRVVGPWAGLAKDSANAWLRQIPGVNFGPFG